ncbi:MAG: carbonic anhydrase/acetyltransferase [Isosphaeraceae bacterium]|nr:carbonic anhydrase/acetyltransferase [Isosphaeraceae bacterium]
MPLEARELLSAGGYFVPSFLTHPAGAGVAARPNTPVLPFAAATKTATFIDPSVRIVNGNHVIIGTKTYIAPFAHLGAKSGFIKIGTGSAVLDNAVINSNPSNAQHPTTDVLIGDSVQVDYGAKVYGPSIIGAYGAAAKPTEIGPNAVINGATVEAGAIVGALAYVGPGVVIPAGYYVLPGASVTTQAQATDPALGKVETTVPATLVSNLKTSLTDNADLAMGYTNLYQGNSATGVQAGAATTSATAGPFNGFLPGVEGASAEPGPTFLPTEPSAALPKFAAPGGAEVTAQLPFYRARVIGGVVVHEGAGNFAHALGLANSIRGDEGQPITIGSITQTGNNVTITSPLSGTLTIGQNFVAGNGAVILGGPTVKAVIGDNVNVGAGAVVSQSSIGDGATIGAGAYVSNSTVAAGATIAPGTILINNVVVGTVQGPG